MSVAFQPTVDDMLTVRGRGYRIAAHPTSLKSPYAIQGRQSVVYQLINSETNEAEYYALKVFEPRYRVPVLASTNDHFVPLADLPGLAVCRREILNASRDRDLLRQYPDLSYAVWMPWIDGLTWAETMLNATKLAPEDSLQLARAFAETLTSMEERGLAHCDLTGENVIVRAQGNSGSHAIELIDIEQMYMPQLDQPPELVGPTAGYVLRKGKARWRATADRFAGAILLTEMLGWCDERIRSLAWGEHYFDPKEMQQETERYQVLHRVIRERWGKPAAAMLKRVWRSRSLSHCPTFLEWLSILPETPAGSGVFERSGAEADMSSSIGEQNAAIRALMNLIKQLQNDGNTSGALAACRQAQALAVGNEPLRSELDQLAESLESSTEQSRVVRPPTLGTGISQETPLVQDLAAAGPADTLSAGSSGPPDAWQALPEVESGFEERPVSRVQGEITEQEPVAKTTEDHIEEERPTVPVHDVYPVAPELSPETKREGWSCFSWLSLLILGIAAGIAVYYFVFMQHNQEVTDLLSRVIGRQPTAVERPRVTPEAPGRPAKPETPSAPISDQPPKGQPGAPAPSPSSKESTSVPGRKPTREAKSSPDAQETSAAPSARSQRTTPTAPIPMPPVVSSDIKPGQSSIRQADGMVIVAVPGGTFRMGTTEEQVKDVLQLCREYSGNCDSDWFNEEQPAHTVSVDSFWIDKTEVTNAQFAHFLNGLDQQALKNVSSWIDLNHSSSQIEDSGGQYQPRNDFDEHPVSLVSWEGAQAYCKWVGARLATEAEWEYAARGPDSPIFPWGNEFDDSRLNYISSSDGYAETAPVGSFPSGASWCGALDMSGNVAEWTVDWFGSYKDEAQKNPKGLALGQYRVNKGGSFQSQPYGTRGAGRGAGSPMDTNRVIGFRCATGP